MRKNNYVVAYELQEFHPRYRLKTWEFIYEYFGCLAVHTDASDERIKDDFHYRIICYGQSHLDEIISWMTRRKQSYTGSLGRHPLYPDQLW